MGLGCGSQIIKVILFVFNLLWLLLGVLLLIVGALIYTKTRVFMQGFENIDVPMLAILIMVVGSITICVSFFGCCGAVQESKCMTLTYSVLLLIIIAVEVTVAIILFVKYKQNTLEEFVNHNIEKVFENEEHLGFVDEMQQYLKCCGTNGTYYWTSKSKDSKVPISCCPDNKPCNAEEYFKEGCCKTVFEFFDENKNIIGYSALGFALVEFVVFVFSCILAKNVGD